MIRISKLRLRVGICLVLSAPGVLEGQERKSAGALVDQFQTRCGWFFNPTPANIWLYDRDGEWTIGVQGGYQVEGEWKWPVFKTHQWIKTNGSYGYGCACLRLRVERQTQNVIEIRSARALPLSVCRKDKSLKQRKKMFK